VLTLDEHLATLLLLCIVGAITFQIVVRIFSLGYPSSWAGETSRYMNVWLVFLLIARDSVGNKHIAVSYFYDKLPEQLLYGIYVINTFVGVMLVFASWNAMNSLGGTVSPAAGIPTWLLYLAGVVGGSLFVLVQLFKLYRDLFKRSD
jgi:TRAP-type C4-dicarboxylate transport system permease small subunit